MSVDLFPCVVLGQNGDKQERAQRGSLLEYKVRLPTIEVVITALSY